jgi:hypothetical protein
LAPQLGRLSPPINETAKSAAKNVSKDRSALSLIRAAESSSSSRSSGSQPEHLFNNATYSSRTTTAGIFVDVVVRGLAAASSAALTIARALAAIGYSPRLVSDTFIDSLSSPAGPVKDIS